MRVCSWTYVLQCGCNRHALVSVYLTYKASAIWKNLWVLSCAYHFWHHSNEVNYQHTINSPCSMLLKFFDVWLGFRELHSGAYTNATPAQLPWRVLLLLLCVYSCPQVLFLSGPNAHRYYMDGILSLSLLFFLGGQGKVFCLQWRVFCYMFYCTGKIKIQDILACGFLDDLLEVSGIKINSLDNNSTMYTSY